jgi:flagellar biosynthesis repressor protein FlbT
MSKTMHISLRPGEKLYVNGAVLSVDRKVSMEFLNDVTFLLENHVLQPEQATTPLRQLYFIVQAILIDPPAAARAREMFHQSHAQLESSFENEQILAGLKAVRDFIHRDRAFDALKAIRALFPIEDGILSEKCVVDMAPSSKELEAATWK